LIVLSFKEELEKFMKNYKQAVNNAGKLFGKWQLR